MEMEGLMNRGIGLFAAFLLALILSGCFGGGVSYPIECISDYPLKNYVYTKSAWGPLNIDNSRYINPSSNPLTKADFLRDWGEPDEIVPISDDKEMWVYNRSEFCGIVPIYFIPIPLGLPVCAEFDHITFENDKAVHIHFRRITDAGAVIGGFNNISAPKKCPVDYVPSGIDAEILPSTPGIISIPHTEECRRVVYRDGSIWWTDGHDIIKIEPKTLEVIDRISVTDRKHTGARDLTDATGFGAVWLGEGGRQHDIVSRIDLSTGEIVANIPLDHSVGPIATGEGSVWVLHDKLLSRIDPQTNQVAAIIPLEKRAGAIAAGEGSVWVLHDKLLSRIDPQTNQVAATIPVNVIITPPIGHEKIVVAGGSVWVVSLPYVFRIDPTTCKIEDTFGLTMDKKSSPNYYFMLDASATEDTLWVLVRKMSRNLSIEHYELVEFDIKTNTVRSITSLGHASGSIYDTFASSSVTVAENTVWVCLPLGIYVIPTDRSHPPRVP